MLSATILLDNQMSNMTNISPSPVLFTFLLVGFSLLVGFFSKKKNCTTKLIELIDLVLHVINGYASAFDVTHAQHFNW